MSTINHDRPVLKVIDDLKKLRNAQVATGAEVARSKTRRKHHERDAIHSEAVICLEHLLKHGNINVVAKFLSQEKCQKHEIWLRAWFSKYGPLKFKSDGQISYSRKAGAPFSTAKEEPFWELAPPKPRQPFNFLEELTTLVDKADRRRLRPTPGDKIDLEALNKIREILQNP